MELHWLSVPERIQFKLAVLVFRCLHGTAPVLRHTLLTSCSGGGLGVTQKAAILDLSQTDILRLRRTSIGDRAFCVAGPYVWNSLSLSTQSAPSLPV